MLTIGVAVEVEHGLNPIHLSASEHHVRFHVALHPLYIALSSMNKARTLQITGATSQNAPAEMDALQRQRQEHYTSDVSVSRGLPVALDLGADGTLSLNK